MKKLPFAFLILTAQAACAVSPTYSGFYASIAGGGTLADFNVDQDFSAMVVDNFEAALPSNIHLQDGSATGLIGLGYSYQFHNHFVLGTEVIAEWTNPEVSHANELFNINIGISGGEAKAQLRNDFALLFKAGYVLHHRTQIYAFIGPRWGNFTTSLTGNFEGFSASDKESAYESGVTAGAGLEHLITTHLSLGLEYAYTNYGNIDSPNAGFINNTVPPLIVTNTSDIKVTTNTVLAKLSYHW